MSQELVIFPQSHKDLSSKDVKLSHSMLDNLMWYSKIETELVLIIIYLVQVGKLGFEDAEVLVSDIKKFTGSKSNSFYKKLHEGLKSLNKKGLELPTEDKGVLFANWFSSARYVPKKGSLVFRLDSNLKPYIAEMIEDYTLLGLWVVSHFHSPHTRNMYLWAKKNKDQGRQVFTIEEFRTDFGISDGVYTEFRELKKKTMTSPIKDLSKKNKSGQNISDMTVEVETIRTGRYITHVALTPTEQDYQPSLPLHLIDPFEEDKESIKKELLGFTSLSVVEGWLDNYELRYLEEKINLVRETQNRKKVPNPGGLLRKAIEQDYQDLEKQQKEEVRETNKKRDMRLRTEKEKRDSESRRYFLSNQFLDIEVGKFLENFPEKKQQNFLDGLRKDNPVMAVHIKSIDDGFVKSHLAKMIPDYETKKEKYIAENL